MTTTTDMAVRLFRCLPAEAEADPLAYAESEVIGSNLRQSESAKRVEIDREQQERLAALQRIADRD